MNSPAPIDETKEILLEACGVGRQVDRAEGKWIFQDVSLSVRKGATLCLTGPTGTGKTLLLRTLALLDTPDQGEVLWKGQALTGGQMPEFRSNVIYVHQHSVLFTGTVEDNLRLPFTLRIHRHRQFDKNQILQWLGRLRRNDSYLQKQDSELSGGERQIVCLLRALQLMPPVLLLDEPLAALDMQTASAVLNLLRDCFVNAKTSHSMLFVSHNRQQIDEMGGDVMQLSDGKLIKEAER